MARLSLSSIMTVTGPIAPEQLGLSAPHEHVISNALLEYRVSGGILNDRPLAIEELGRFVRAGGSTLVEVTSTEIGRDPPALREIAEATGLNLVMGCGHYRDPYLDRDWFDRMSTDDIASEMIAEINDGVEKTGIRPGIIGEIGADKWYISAAEERSFRAAARAHSQTGLTITTHAARWPIGLLQLDILLSEGVHPSRIIIGHADTVPSIEYHLEVVRRGAYIEFDGFGTEPPYETQRSVKSIYRLVSDGFASQILLSQDVFQKSQLHAYGGNGYDYILTHAIEDLDRAGVRASVANQMMTDNVRAALTGECQ